uniref:FXYD domain-containing ion transport regulator n=1 Tax=Oryzias latipes TaxID=8090 RepID=A0A3P9H541_ORYLA
MFCALLVRCSKRQHIVTIYVLIYFFVVWVAVIVLAKVVNTSLTFLIFSSNTTLSLSTDPFVYNYEGLRIGGLVIVGLLIAGAVVLLTYNQCARLARGKQSDDSAI